MTAQSFQRALRAFTRRRPFQPYLVEFVSGEQITVHHPEAVATWSEDVIFTSREQRYRWFDATTVCQLLDVPGNNPS